MSAANEWQTISLGDCGVLRNGVNFNQTQEGVGLPVLKVKDFGTLTIMPTEGLDELNPQAIKIPKDQYLQAGDSVIIRSNGNGALVGRSLFVRNLLGTITFSGFCIRFRPDLNIIDPQFAAYFIRSPLCRQRFTAFGSGTGIQNLNQETISNIELDLPPLQEQRAIARILGALDDKIELNRRMNHTQEAIVKALFRSWFIEFEPVSAKRDGRKPVGMDDATASLFPEHFQDSEIGPIPQGWRIEKVEDCIARHGVGKKYEQKTVQSSGDVPVLDQGRSGIIGYHNDTPGVNASEDNPIIVFANHTCYMRIITFPFSAIQNVLPFTGKNLDTIWTFFATEGLQEFLEYKGHWPDFVINKIVVPTEELTKAFGSAINGYMKRIRRNEIQNETLSSIRDTLLPKLLSGELRVGQAEEMIP